VNPALRARNHPGYWAFLVHRVSGVLLALYLPAHFTGGLRLLALEFLPWREWHKGLAAVAAGVSLALALAFALAL
jgi:fumarate reductase subunit D